MKLGCRLHHGSLARWGWLAGLGSLALGLGIVVPVQTAVSAPRLAAMPNRSLGQTMARAGGSALEVGVREYEAGRPGLALQAWQEALAQSSPSDRPLIHSYLSLAYQQLGRWSEAEAAIAQAQQDLIPTRSPELEARVLNAQGRLQWSRGQAEAALRSWQGAEQRYRQLGDGVGMRLAALNSIQALRSLGFNAAAEAQLVALAARSPVDASQPDPLVARTLGALLLQVGKLQEARQVLQAGLPSQGLGRAQALLDLGNVERAVQQRAKGLGKVQVAQAAERAALEAYGEAERVAVPGSPGQLVQLQARLNRLALLIQDRPGGAAAFQEAQVPSQEAIALAVELERNFPALPPGREALQARLNLAESLTALGQDPSGVLRGALEQAQALQDPVMRSYALGLWGAWYERQGQWGQAQQLTAQALVVIDPLQVAAVRYRWEWQLGRLLKRQGDQAGAIAAYRAAVESLQAVRTDLLSTSSEVQFSFRDDVEPVYRGLVGLLLDVPAGQTPSQAVLKQAIAQVDALQLAELENFLGCKLSQVVDLGAVTLDPTAAKVYPLILEDRLAVVVEPPGNGPLQYHEVRRSRSEVHGLLQQLRQDLANPGRTPEALAGLQTVHQWLIEPLEERWAGSTTPVETLVFVLDGELRNVPMAALYDGEDYLISRYAVALSPRLQLFDPRARSPQLSLLLGGVGEPQRLGDRNFPEIANLEPELDGIRQFFPAPQPLVNQAFTKANLAKSLASQAFSAIHIKTHGIFSSDPEETFVVAYQDVLTGEELGQLLQGRGERVGTPSPIELLILSACSTAQGDNRAVLGMAGLAVQAGARSVVSTLWEAQDVPNTALMIKFYEELKNPKTSRAQALRTAQLSLLDQGYTTPHVWATYVLVGNWL